MLYRVIIISNLERVSEEVISIRIKLTFAGAGVEVSGVVIRPSPSRYRLGVRG